MKRSTIALSIGLMILSLAKMGNAGEEGQEYVVFRLPGGSSVMEKAWVVSSRVIVTTPFETAAYLADKDGVFTGSKAGAKFLTRNRARWLKVYTSDVDLAVSKDVPQEITEAFTGLSSAIERAGGLERFRMNMRPNDRGRQKRQAPTVTVRNDLMMNI